MHPIEQLRKWSNGEWLMETNPDAIVAELTTDSRNTEQPSHALFVALKTHLRNGHDFVGDAWQKGVRNFLVCQPVDVSILPGSNIILVKDTLAALQHIATANRKQYHVPVVGITGSNGKTIVKEWLSALLSEDREVIKSPGSYNSQTGVPLSVWKMEEKHQIAVFEAGISQPGEMEKLERIIQPDLGIFTNIGEAHSEGFLNTRQKINEKLVLFRHAKQLIYCRDHTPLHECIVQFMNMVRRPDGDDGLQLITWSRKQAADLQITHTEVIGGSTTITGLYAGTERTISIPFADEVSAENAITVWCALLVLGMPQTQITNRMATLQPVSMRMEMRQGINDCTIINDTYNSDLTSLQMALNYLAQQRQHAMHTVIMSDIMQPSQRDLDLYDEVAGLISRRNIQRFIGIGPALYKNKAVFRKNRKVRSIFFKSTEHFLKNFHLLTFDKEAILLKGARAFTFEKIGVLLEQKVHQTVMTIDLQALRSNLDVYRSLLAPGVKTMAMVKAFAYGSGSYETASVLQYAGIDYMAVAYTDEGVTLRRAGIRTPIMVMSPDLSSFDRMIAWKLEPELYSFRSLDAFVTIARTLQVQDYPVHIKLDTGMHRLGFGNADMPRLSAALRNLPELHIASIFSHLAASDNAAEDEFTHQQANAFQQMSQHIMAALPYKPLRHLSNSAGISRLQPLQFDMVRLGLGLYGIDGNAAIQARLHPVSTLRTTIAQIRDVPAGDSIGYGHQTIATGNMRIATICIGYADGYPRSLGHGRAHVLIKGKTAPTIGIICMDMCMVDITDINGVAEGDDAIVFGPLLPVTELAHWAGTIPYEIMTGISQRVKRVYTNGG
jgi:alanine racemase